MASSRERFEVAENDSNSSEESLNSSMNSSMTSESDQEEKTVSEILASLNDEEVSELLKNRVKLKTFYTSLLKCMKNSEREEEIRKLRGIIEKVAKRSKHLQQLVAVFLHQRRNLLEILKRYSNKIDVITKLCNAGKLASSVIDCAGLIGSSVIKRTNSFYINTVFQTANAAGLLGFGFSAAELVIWRTALEDLMREIQKDQDFFAPIQEWFQQNNELEQAVQAIIPFKLTAFLVNEFEKSIAKELSDFELFQNIFTSVLMEDRERIRNATLIQNLMDFISCPAARHWCRWIFLRNHKVTLDVAKMLLQLNSPQQLVSSQSVGTLTRFGSNSETVAFWGRVILNFWSIYNAVCTLRNGEMVNEMRKLEKHLRQEMEALIQIERHIRRRGPS